MLNRAARYFPIVRELKNIGPHINVLDVGSGPRGIGEFWLSPFVGCDVILPGGARGPMRPVVCSGTELAFRDLSFDAVVVSDVMEHLAPERRSVLVQEVLRVARKVAIFGYPCGPLAFALDEKLRQNYQRRGLATPVWLEEHMLHPFPQEDLFSDIPSGWSLKVVLNESLRFHYWMMRTEMHRLCDYAFRFGLVLMPKIAERLLQQMDREPSYRKIFVLQRQETVC